jgi:dolichol-phosphate mannosyltransferase
VKNYEHCTHKISVIVPTYCEAKNISSMVNTILAALKTNNLPNHEIILVDDNSPDDTKKVCQSLVKQNPVFRPIFRISERGLATAIKKGITEATGDILVILDADMSHDPVLIPLLVNEISKNGSDIVIASRFIDGHQMQSSFHKVLGSKVLNTFIRILLQIPAKDVTGGFHAIRKEALKNIDLDSIFRGYGDYSFALLYKGVRQGLKIKEIGFTYKERKNGLSKTKFIRAGIYYGVRAIRLRLGME